MNRRANRHMPYGAVVVHPARYREGRPLAAPVCAQEPRTQEVSGSNRLAPFFRLLGVSPWVVGTHYDPRVDPATR